MIIVVVQLYLSGAVLYDLDTTLLYNNKTIQLFY